MKKFLKEIYPYVLIIIVVVLFRTFIATPVRVDGASMYPTLSDGNILILNKLNKKINRFDIVVINFENAKLVKRIIGLPGEKIEYNNNKLYINGEEIDDVAISRTSNFSLKQLYDLDRIPDNYYFVMGDNRNNSSDSRDYRIGLIREQDIIGTTTIRLFPFNKIGKFN